MNGGRKKHNDALVYEYTDIPEGVSATDLEDEESELYQYPSDNSNISGDEDQNMEEMGTYTNKNGDDNKDGSNIPSSKDIPDSNVREKEEGKRLPDYIPSYFPPFPTEPKDVDALPATDIRQPPLPGAAPAASSNPLAMTASTSASNIVPPSTNAAAPIIVKNRKKPVENPFTHVVPFEESTLATERNSSLSLLVQKDENRNRDQQPPSSPKKRRKVASTTPSMKHALEALSNNNGDSTKRKARLGLAGNQEVFRKYTQDEAAPGNTMFGNDTGVLGSLLRSIAPPAMVSKLSSPNLLVDVVSIQPPSQTSVAAASTVTIPATVTTNGGDKQAGKETSGPTKSSSASMLATLAGGQYNKKQHGDVSSSSVAMSQGPSVTFATSSPLTTTTASGMTITHEPVPATTTAATGAKSTPSPISLASLSSASASSDISKKKKLPKLTLNLSGNDAQAATIPTSAEQTPSSGTPLNTPKIRFKIKAPEPSAEELETSRIQQQQQVPLAPPPPPAATAADQSADDGTDIINCICDNPSVDFGTFMIACDKCGVWYHGSCVGVAESDQVEEWYCSRCKS